VEVTGRKWYGFDMKKKNENEIADDIVNGWLYCNMEEKIIGWKNAKDLPSWVKDWADWTKYEHLVTQKETASHRRSSNINEEEDKDEYVYNKEEEDDNTYNDNEGIINLEKNLVDSGKDGDNNELTQMEISQSLLMTTTLTKKKKMNPTNVDLPENTSHTKKTMKVKKIIMNPTNEVFVIIIIIIIIIMMMTKMKVKKTITNPTNTKMTMKQIITNHTNVNAPVGKLMTLVKLHLLMWV
jgi:hypothetical protein